MISLKRNSKLELVAASGRRTRQSSIYQCNQTVPFKISRGKFSDFLTCPRCFYLDRVKGLASPGMPGWTLNETTDLLLKKEFDSCRSEQKPHRVCIENDLQHLIPFDHPDMDKWRDALRNGLMINYQNIILTGGVDDIWKNRNTEELVVVDYKSQASRRKVETHSYLSSAYHEGYKIQMDFYTFLLKEMGFNVSNTAYFYVCNADRNAEGFYGKLDFSETLIPYQTNISWIPSKLEEMLETLNSVEVPASNKSCENCAYAYQRRLIESHVDGSLFD
jgi:CRISPR/Cas system-associated exonuclease Cas4 (RecB family)